MLTYYYINENFETKTLSKEDVMEQWLPFNYLFLQDF